MFYTVTGKVNERIIMNKDTPLVSIIVVTYNSSLYVEETLDSAFRQDYKNIECDQMTVQLIQ